LVVLPLSHLPLAWHFFAVEHLPLLHFDMPASLPVVHPVIAIIPSVKSAAIISFFIGYPFCIGVT
jgi:hypothetical protein